MSILTTALELPEPTKPSAAAHTTSIEDPAKAPQSLQLLEQAQAPIEAQSKSTASIEAKAAYTTSQKSTSMFTTNKPPKYNGPINGRDRRINKPKDFVLPDEEEDAENYEAMLQYLSIYSLEDRQETPSMVYACPKCEVRIANEDDMVTRPFIWSNEELSLNAVFKKTSNLVACGEDVCCYRCRTKLFDYCAEDPFLLTVPMFQAQNKQTLLKRAYRMLNLTYVTGFALVGTNRQGKAIVETDADYLSVLRKVESNVQGISSGRAQDRTRIITFAKGDSPLKKTSCSQREREQLMESLKLSTGLNSEFCLLEELHQRSVFKGIPAVDFAMFFRVGEDGRDFITHTDVKERFTEKVHLLLWLATGGNFLFADWGSYETVGGPQKASDTVDMAREAKQWGFTKAEINLQPAFAKLIRDGHFLGRWGFGKRKEDSAEYEEIFEPTKKMWKKISQALHGDLLYPHWLFLHDYPGSIFMETKRTRDKAPYSREALDAIRPRTLKGMKQHRASGDSRCSKLLEALGLQDS